MAERRMFAKTIIDSDAFLDMALTTQSLYFHLSMRADDDGFVNNPKKIARMIGCNDDELMILTAKRFILSFESGVIVIKHWKVHNYIRNDRYKETVYIDEKEQLSEKKNKSYTIGMTSGIPNGYQLDTQVRLGKDSIGKNIILVQQIDEIWNLYPRKKGKAIAIKKIPLLIKKHSFEIIKRCVERYADEVSDKDMQFIKNGSTFFNSGYQDYLADDYVPEIKTTPKGNKFHNFKDDENAEEKKLEEILLKRGKNNDN